jgi:serine/threonine-protein kinase
MRTALGERDRLFLDANEPYMERQPPDLDEVARRLDALVARYPGDAELALYHSHFLANIGDHEGAAKAADRVSTLDPTCVNAWVVKFASALYGGDAAGAEKALDDCEHAIPGAVPCVRARAITVQQRGECARLELIARSVSVRDPSAARAFGLLAEALASQGRPREAIAEALEQKWSRLSGGQRPIVELEDRVHLAMLVGDFREAERRTAELEKRAASEPSEDEHARPALIQLDIDEETGRTADAGKLASAYLSRVEGWSRNPATDDEAIANDPTPRMLAAKLHAKAIAAADYAASRDAWLASWRARTSPFYAHYLWHAGWAVPAQTPAEARNALAARPLFEPLPAYQPSMLAPAFEGNVYLLADRLDDAVASLERATRACVALAYPVEHTRALEQLATARERKHDTTAACGAYAGVVARWGKAVPKSVTAERAKARMAALRCP